MPPSKIIKIFFFFSAVSILTVYVYMNGREDFTTQKLEKITEIKQESKKETKEVMQVIDGDTIILKSGERVRYIGIDAPEMDFKKGNHKCFAYEAFLVNRVVVMGRELKLEKDASEKDLHGRLLRYIWIDDMLLNEYLVREGFAKATPINPDIKYADRIFQAQKQAIKLKKGLWGLCEKTDEKQDY